MGEDMKSAAAMELAHGSAATRLTPGQEVQLPMGGYESDTRRELQQFDVAIDTSGSVHSRQATAAGESFGFAASDNPASVWPSFLAGHAEKPVRVVVVDDDTHIRR